MMRVSESGCGCSLREGTLVVLSVDLVSHILLANEVFWIVLYYAFAQNFLLYFSIVLLVIVLIVLVTLIYAIVGAIKRRPSFMLPHLILRAINLILFGLFGIIVILMLLTTPTKQIIDKIVEPKGLRPNSTVSPEDRNLSRRIRGIYIQGTIEWLLILCLEYYFLCVAYSYYKEMLEEGDRTSSPTTSVMHSAIQGQPSGQSQRKTMVTLNLQTQASYLPQSAADHENPRSVFSPSVASKGSLIRTIPI